MPKTEVNTRDDCWAGNWDAAGQDILEKLVGLS